MEIIYRLLSFLIIKYIFLSFILTFMYQPIWAGQDKLVVAFSHWPPWKVITKDSYGGIDAELIREIENRTKIKFEFKGCPFKRCIQMIEDGDADIITSFSKTSKRAKFVSYITPPYDKEKIVCYVKKENKALQIKDYEDLYKLKVGTTKGTVYFDKFDNDTNIKKEVTTYDIQLLRMLENRRIDVIIGSEITFDYLIIKKGFQGKFKKASYYVDQPHGVHLAISKKSKVQKLIPKISSVIKVIVENNEIPKIVKKYFRTIKSK